MKYIFFTIYLMICINSSIYCQDYEETLRQYIQEKLVFYYIDDVSKRNPISDKKLDDLEVDKTSIANNQNISNPIWTKPTNIGMRNLLIKLLRSKNNGGDLRLQMVVANVLLITDKKVYVYLYNDMPNLSPHNSWEVYCNSSLYPAAHNNASWPCANTFSDRKKLATGHIGMGAYFFDSTRTAGGWTSHEDKMHVFIHELVHTQVPNNLEHSLGNTSMYGAGGHAFDELLPSKNAAFNEGIATAFAMRYHFPFWMDLSNWYNANRKMNVDILPSCSASANPPPHCLHARLTHLGLSSVGSCPSATTCFPIKRVPPEIIPYTEIVSCNILFQYMNLFNSEMMLVRDVKNAINDMNNKTIYTFLPLFHQMVQSGKRFQNPTVSSGTLVRGHLLPLALVDYYSGYKVYNLGNLNKFLDSNYEGFPNKQNYIDYFNLTGSQKLREFRKDTLTWSVNDQLVKFAEYLNVKTPSAPGPLPASPSGGK